MLAAIIRFIAGALLGVALTFRMVVRVQYPVWFFSAWAVVTLPPRYPFAC